MEKRYLQRKEMGLCSACEKQSVNGTVYCKDHLEKQRAYQKEYREKRKQDGNCLWCGCLQKKSDNGNVYCEFHSKKLKELQPEKYRRGLSEETLQEMFECQNHKCKICKTKAKSHKNLCVDHCHSTDKIRGLICSNCNSGLGFFKDNPKFLKAAIEYLNTNDHQP